MPRETQNYRDNLEDILKFFNYKRSLTLADIRLYTGVADNRTLKRRYPSITGHTVSAPTLARLMTGESQ